MIRRRDITDHEADNHRSPAILIWNDGVKLPGTSEVMVTESPAGEDNLIIGRVVAAEIERRALAACKSLQTQGVQPTLAVLYRGDHGDAASYRKMIRQRAGRTGVTVTDVALPADASEREVVAALEHLEDDAGTHAILVQNPLPSSLRQAVGKILSTAKDVEGLSAGNLGKLVLDQPCVTPCTPGAIVALIESRIESLRGKHVVIINRSATIGRPLSQLLLNRRATVTVCSSATVDLPGESRRGDVLVVAIGKARAVGADYVGKGAVVIDVGINADPSGNGVCGDVDTESALTRASAITPVPGGVGPVTTAILIENVVELARAWHFSHAPVV
jgi:methylenetetrahydrofolate dehydrogenase (NADP+) / methenyltetrahydrofolate cyclohydrolase